MKIDALIEKLAAIRAKSDHDLSVYIEIDGRHYRLEDVAAVATEENAFEPFVKLSVAS